MPSSQDIAKWVETHLQYGKWHSIKDAMLFSITKAMPGASIELQTDLVEEHIKYVEEILRNKRADLIADGGISSYELGENDPYIQKINKPNTDIAAKLRNIDPYVFEVVCKRILQKLGATAENTQKSDDGGVDFYALDFPYSSNFPLPKTAAMSVIGQAKRYKEGNNISVSEIRKFIGGAMLILDDLKKQGKINVLSPIVYAFWTTSDLNLCGREFSRKMGIWHLDGMALAEYVIKLDLEKEFFKD